MTKSDVLALVRNWFRAINDHAPLPILVGMLAENGFELRFPEATLRSREDLERWYGDVTAKFFDQVHEVKMVEVDLRGDSAEVALLVNWRARTWQPPQAYSKALDFDAVQTWSLAARPVDGRPVIVRHSIESLIDNRQET